MILVLLNKTPAERILQAGMKCWYWGELSTCSPSGTRQPDGGVLDGGRFDGLIILRQWPDLKTAFISAIKMKVLLTSASNSSGEGDGTPLQYSCLENPRDGGAWWAACLWGCTESDTSEAT